METSNYVPGVRRRQVTPLYDTYSVAAGATATKVVLFGSVAGTVGLNKTNMTRAFELPGPEKFTMFSLQFTMLGVAPADMLSLYQNYVLRLIRGRVVELEAPIDYFAGGSGMSGVTTATTVSYMTNGVPNPTAVRSLGDNPIIIEGSDHFEVNLEGVSFTASAAIFARVILDGYFDKGVQ